MTRLILLILISLQAQSYAIDYLISDRIISSIKNQIDSNNANITVDKNASIGKLDDGNTYILTTFTSNHDRSDQRCVLLRMLTDSSIVLFSTTSIVGKKSGINEFFWNSRIINKAIQLCSPDKNGACILQFRVRNNKVILAGWDAVGTQVERNDMDGSPILYIETGRSINLLTKKVIYWYREGKTAKINIYDKEIWYTRFKIIKATKNYEKIYSFDLKKPFLFSNFDNDTFDLWIKKNGFCGWLDNTNSFNSCE